MPSRKEYPVNFTPRGLADAWDSTESFHGACLSLQNLVFDQSNPDLMTSRPGVGTALTSFSTFTGASAVTIIQVVGNYAYGMVSTTRLGSFDEPFAYNLLTNTFTAITGTLNTNLPSTQSTTGNWNPPSMAVIGPNIIVTHPGFSGSGANFFGIINISNVAAPTWTASNTATNALPSAPRWVSNFNNRAYFACGNVVYYSDALVPAKMTNAGQSLTIGDTSSVTGMSGLPIQTSTSGVVGSLMVFKGLSVWQVTGDASVTNSLALTFLSLNVGCVAPNTITQTPAGLFFIGIDGPYYISSLGQVLPLTKDPSKLVQDVQKPFQNIVNPGRANAAFTGSIYRVSLTTVINGMQQWFDYWFDVTVRRWSGPHTFGYDCISNYSNYFICSNTSLGAKLFASQYIPVPSSVYNDNGTQLNVLMQTSFMPKTQNINVKQVITTTAELSSGTNNIQYLFSAFGENFQLLNSTSINSSDPVYLWGTLVEGGSGLVWGTMSEGGSGKQWSSGLSNPVTYTIPWTAPLVFKKLSLTLTTASSYNIEIGSIFFKYIDTGYTNI